MSLEWGQNDNLTDEQLANKLLYYSEIIVRREKSVTKSHHLSEQAVVAKNLSEFYNSRFNLKRYLIRTYWGNFSL